MLRPKSDLHKVQVNRGWKILVRIPRVNPYGMREREVRDSERGETRYLGNTSEMTGGSKC